MLALRYMDWKRTARRLFHWLWTIFSTRICSEGVAGWNSVVRSERRASNSSRSSPGIKSVAQLKPWETRLREDLALPSLVFGPVDSCALARLAVVWASVAMGRTPLHLFFAPGWRPG